MKISSVCRTKIATRSLIALSTFVLIIASTSIFGFSAPADDGPVVAILEIYYVSRC